MIIELLGLAGAGKSSLCHQICDNPNVICITRIPYYRRINELPFYIRNSTLLLPTLILDQIQNKVIREEKILWMVALNGWYHKLTRLAKRNKFVILDEGPIFYLAYFYAYQLLDELITQKKLHLRGEQAIFSLAYEHSFGAQARIHPNVFRWFNRMLAVYAQTIDAVLWLEATNQVLIDRVRNRHTPHGIKNRSDQEANTFLNNFRMIYKTIVDKLIAEDPQLSRIDIDTDKYQTSDISNMVSQFLRISD